MELCCIVKLSSTIYTSIAQLLFGRWSLYLRNMVCQFGWNIPWFLFDVVSRHQIRKSLFSSNILFSPRISIQTVSTLKAFTYFGSAQATLNGEWLNWNNFQNIWQLKCQCIIVRHVLKVKIIILQNYWWNWITFLKSNVWRVNATQIFWRALVWFEFLAEKETGIGLHVSSPGKWFKWVDITYHINFRMWSLRRASLLSGSRSIRHVLSQQDKTLINSRLHNFSGIGFSRSPKQVTVIIVFIYQQIFNEINRPLDKSGSGRVFSHS